MLQCSNAPMLSLFTRVLFFTCASLSEAISQATFAIGSNDDLRNDARLPVKGTKNWQLLPQRGTTFSPRHSHATTVYKCPHNPSSKCLWLTGGYSELHRSFDLRMENENCDVWYSKDGREWNQVGLDGDFIQGVGNWDAKPGSFAAPWYARYGHSLNALDDEDGDGIADVMILAGGNNPMPSNDVWLSTDGLRWYFDGLAPWPKRAYHSTAVFQGKLFILGGTPLSNSVWAGNLVKNSTRAAGYTMKWIQMKDAPWTPRAGACAIAHSFNDEDDDIGTEEFTNNTSEALFILGGLAGYSEDDPDYEGIRTRNDVWKTADGESWHKVMTNTTIWAGRAFHGCTSWRSNDNDPTTPPKMFVLGGGYMGTEGNREVRSLETYTDTWWSYNGAEWMKVNYDEGSIYTDNLYSTNEWTEITVEGGRKVYRGKWGFSVEGFVTSQDLNGDGEISTESTMMKACTNANKTQCKTVIVTEEQIPALFLIGGKVEGLSVVSDTFVSKPGINCELRGITCSNKGTCGVGVAGCICHSSNFTGNYCTND